MKMMILNLDRSTTKEELKALFEEYGTVESCELVLDQSNGKSKGFGFVEILEPKGAGFALKKLNNRIVGSNRIRVKKAEDKKV